MIARNTSPKRRFAIYLGGNPPMHWLKGARLAGASALSVGLYLLHLRGMGKNSPELVVTRKGALKVLGINRSSLTTGLTRLERVGLITTARGRGKSIRVTLLGLEEEAPAS